METSFDPILSSAAAAERAKQEALFAPKELGREEFLQLLIAKLENQDPLAPSQDTEFISQLATFSSLEQLISANDNLENLAVGQATLVNSQALGLIGKDALVAGTDSVSIRSGKPDTLVYTLPKPASQATLTIYSSDGAPVRTFELERTAGGRHVLEWDGLDDDGNPVGDGEYRIEVNAADSEGEPMEIALFQSVRIEGVTFVNGAIALISGNREIPFDSIVEFRAGD